MATATANTSNGVITGEVVGQNKKSVWLKVGFEKKKIDREGKEVTYTQSTIIKRHRTKHGVQVQD